MKNNKLAKFMAIVLLITLVAIILVSGTYAKYTSSATGSDSATVAKWSIKLGENDMTKSKTFSVNLFDTVADTKDAVYTTENPEADTDVKAGKLIAPGTYGKFTLAELTNESEVNAEYSVTYKIENTGNVPLEFSKDGNSWSTDIESIKTDKVSLPMKSGDSATAVKTPTVYWRWTFTDDSNEATRDEKDTNLGTAETAQKVTITATVNVEQVD